MIHNNQKLSQSWSPADRRLWLAKHGAPDHFTLLTILEVAAIQQGLEAEHRARMALQAEVVALTADRDRLDWLCAHKAEAKVNGGPDDGGKASAWVIAAATGTLREAIDAAKKAEGT